MTHQFQKFVLESAKGSRHIERFNFFLDAASEGVKVQYFPSIYNSTSVRLSHHEMFLPIETLKSLLLYPNGKDLIRFNVARFESDIFYWLKKEDGRAVWNALTSFGWKRIDA